MIEFRAVCKDYQGLRVVDTLFLNVEAEERVVLFGPSGCCKSTVLHLIAGLVIPDSGDILVNEESKEIGAAKARSDIPVVTTAEAVVSTRRAIG